MIICRFVDVNSISSALPRSSFEESELEQIANLILATDGLLRPLILKESGVEKYTVVEGHREYYAALRAKEKDIRKAEMVNAFVINSEIQQSAIEQLSLINEGRSHIITPVIDPTDAIVEKLLPTLLANISQLIQPMVVQLDEQKKILDVLLIDRVKIEPDNRQLAIDKIPDSIAESTEISPSPIPVAVVEPTSPKIEKIKVAKTRKSSSKNKNVTTLVESMISTNPSLEQPSKETNTLELINTLSQDALNLKMERSSISKTVLKLVPNIIASRNSQPDRKFETWETISAAKIKGLGPAKIKEIIDKLK